LSKYVRMALLLWRAKAWIRQTSMPRAARYWTPPRLRACPPHAGAPERVSVGLPVIMAAALIVSTIAFLVGQVPLEVGDKGDTGVPLAFLFCEAELGRQAAVWAHVSW